VVTERPEVVTLRESAPPDLREVRARRRQLFSLLIVVLALTFGGLVLISYASELFLHERLLFLNTDVLRVAFILLAVAFTLYVWERERALSRVEAALIEERVLSTALSNRVRELTALSQASRAVASVLSLDDVLGLILESAQDLLGATEGSLMLFDADKSTLRIAASVGLDRDVTKVIPVGESVAGWVAEFREPVILRGDVSNSRFRAFIPKGRPVRSAMSAPLYARAEPVGVLNVSVTSGDRRYTEHDLRALSVFAEHAAIAIANARLFERERQTSTRLADLDERRREFLSVITHDLKTPLTSILGYASLLRDRGGEVREEYRREFADTVIGQSQRMLEMVEQLIVATSLEEGGPVLSREPLDLSGLVKSSVDAFRGVLHDRDVQLAIPDALPTVFGDRSAVEHILANLLDNAVKYSPEGSPLSVAIEEVASEVRVMVADRGPGIPEDLRDRVFDRYRRGDMPGRSGSVGLGLFIVRSLAENHGGRVWADEAPGGGARITFTLPVRSDRQA
jgi:two-component system, OmpR family, sensor histidine kinase KdpD